jgi:Outer membrane protein beta-barrel domain
MGVLVLAMGICGSFQTAAGQALPTATEESRLSVFGGASGVYTNIEGGKNLGITAGADYALRGFFGFRPALEVRGTYPIDDGHVDNQKSILAGVRVERPLGRLRPYGDFLIGRGEIKYAPPIIIGFAEYFSTDTAIYSPGAGFEYDMTPHFALRVDGQLQHWNTPVVPAGSVWAKQGTVGVTYRFDFNHHWHQRRQ